MVVSSVGILQLLELQIVLLQHLILLSEHTCVRLQQVPDRVTILFLGIPFVINFIGFWLSPCEHRVFTLDLKVGLLEPFGVLITADLLLIFSFLQLAQARLGINVDVDLGVGLINPGGLLKFVLLVSFV